MHWRQGSVKLFLYFSSFFCYFSDAVLLLFRYFPAIRLCYFPATFPLLFCYFPATFWLLFCYFLDAFLLLVHHFPLLFGNFFYWIFLENWWSQSVEGLLSTGPTLSSLQVFQESFLHMVFNTVVCRNYKHTHSQSQVNTFLVLEFSHTCMNWCPCLSLSDWSWPQIQ